jgi:hypothetical protein
VFSKIFEIVVNSVLNVKEWIMPKNPKEFLSDKNNPTGPIKVIKLKDPNFLFELVDLKEKLPEMQKPFLFMVCDNSRVNFFYINLRSPQEVLGMAKVAFDSLKKVDTVVSN